MNGMWKYVPFCDAVEICDNQRKPINSKERAARIEGKHPSELYPYYGATGQVGFIDDYITDGEYVLLGEDGAPFLNTFAKKAYIISGKAWVNNHAHVLRSKGSNKFLCYYLNYFNYKGYVSGTTRLKLTQAQMKMIPIPVPPIEEQERIVARIEELFSELDNGVETLRKTKQQLAVYRQAVLKDTFLGCEKHVSVSSVCTHVTDGDHMPPPKAASGIPFIMISNIDGNQIDFSETAFVGRDYYESIDSKRRPQVGDVLYSVTGSFGIPVLVDFEKEFCFQRHIALLRPNDKILSEYLYYAMQAPEVYAQASKDATGTAQKTVGLSVLRRILIPYTESKLEQEEIVRDIENKMSVCDSIEKTVDTALQQGEAMRQSILKQAFEGKL